VKDDGSKAGVPSALAPTVACARSGSSNVDWAKAGINPDEFRFGVSNQQQPSSGHVMGFADADVKGTLP